MRRFGIGSVVLVVLAALWLLACSGIMGSGEAEEVVIPPPPTVAVSPPPTIEVPPPPEEEATPEEAAEEEAADEEATAEEGEEEAEAEGEEEVAEEEDEVGIMLTHVAQRPSQCVGLGVGLSAEVGVGDDGELGHCADASQLLLFRVVVPVNGDHPNAQYLRTTHAPHSGARG